jgi:hypothetical protein
MLQYAFGCTAICLGADGCEVSLGEHLYGAGSRRLGAFSCAMAIPGCEIAVCLLAHCGEKRTMTRLRDIDYAAVAVKKAIVEKFRDVDVEESLQVMAGQRTIFIEDNGRTAEGTRDDLLAAVRKATSYADLWAVLAADDKIVG